MRKTWMRVSLLVFFGLLALVLVPGIALTQFPGGGGGGGRPPGGGGGGGGSFDAAALFDRFYASKGYAEISEMRMGRDQAMQYAQAKGITNGRLTREQYIDYMATRATGGGGGGGSSGGGGGGPPGGGGGGFGGRPGGGGGPPGGGGGPPGGGGSSGGNSPPGLASSSGGNSPPGFGPRPGSSGGSSSGSPPSSGGGWGGGGGGWGGGGGSSGGDPDQVAEYQFRGRDGNGDGILNWDEMSESLRTERDKFDMNQDGFIDLPEYKEYIKGWMAQRQAEQGGDSNQGWGGQGYTPQINPEAEKPVVFRSGKLPRDIPGWFTTADGDKDAQVGLFEWKKQNWNLDDFGKVDRNNDGFLTVEEVLRHLNGGKLPASYAVANNSSSGYPSNGGSSGYGSYGGGNSGGGDRDRDRDRDNNNGGRPSGNNGYGGGSRGGDPGGIFDMRSQGKGFVTPNDFNTWREPLTRWIQQKGITNGQVTREQFIEFAATQSGR